MSGREQTGGLACFKHSPAIKGLSVLLCISFLCAIVIPWQLIPADSQQLLNNRLVFKKFLRFQNQSSLSIIMNNNKWEQKQQELLQAAKSGVELATVDLSNLQLTEFPTSLLFPFKDTLEFINLGGNHLTDLPDELSQFQRIKILFFAGNDFETIPIVLGSLPNLYMLSFKGNKLKFIDEKSVSPSIAWLILTDNQLKELPSSVGRLTGLRKLMLTGNMFEHLPEAIQHCHSLQLLRISLNQLRTLPIWLLEMPNLSWLAFSGNPCCNSTNNYASQLPVVDISLFSVEEKLGEGASSLVYKVRRIADGQERALKLYKGAITSDGKAEDEIYAISLLGQHSSLLSPEAIVQGHESGNIGILLPLIRTEEGMSSSSSISSSQPVYRILGLPPSFTSITRDTYPGSHLSSFASSWTLGFVLSTLHDIANVAAHLHQRGIMHGDLYAHNILVKDKIDENPTENSQGHYHAILTDFGAASLTNHLHISSNGTNLIDENIMHEKIRVLFEQIELRAFAHLMDDLLSNISDIDDSQREIVDELRVLQRDILEQQANVNKDFVSFAKAASVIYSYLLKYQRA